MSLARTSSHTLYECCTRRPHSQCANPSHTMYDRHPSTRGVRSSRRSPVKTNNLTMMTLILMMGPMRQRRTRYRPFSVGRPSHHLPNSVGGTRATTKIQTSPQEPTMNFLPTSARCRRKPPQGLAKDARGSNGGRTLVNQPKNSISQNTLAQMCQ